MTPRVVVFFSPDHDLYHTSLLMTGLCTLARRREIRLQSRWPRAEEEKWLAGDPIVVCLDIEPQISQIPQITRRVAIDLRDGEGLSWPIIDRVDLYLKRAFYPPELARLPSWHANKIQPFGLNFGCRNTTSTMRFLRTLAIPLIKRGRAGVSRLRQFLTVPPISAFEQGPEAAVEPKVMFQTRLWTRDEIPADEVEPLNTSRVAMVRALRRAFGERFVGGLVPTPYALAHYRDDVTPHPSRYAAYLALKKRCLISVYTRGVEHSLAFKLGETIAASQCLVSVPLRYELPAPLVPEQHYLPFDTTDEAVEACQRLLEDAALASRMRRANYRYYVEQVEPAAHVSRVLARSLPS